MERERVLVIKDRPWWERALDYLYTPSCPGCGELPIYGLCSECLEQIKPLRLQLHSGLVVYSGGFYEGSLKRAILTLKKSEQTYLHYAIVHLLMRALPAEFRRRPFYCLSIPANAERLRRRGFYVPDLFIKELLRQIPSWQAKRDWLIALRNFQVQKFLGRRERFQNIENGYSASSSVQGQKIILVDDVLTTGATLTEAAFALLQKGAKEILALTAAVSPHLCKADVIFEELVPNTIKIGDY